MKPYACDACGHVVEAGDPDSFVAALTDHVRSAHDWPYPDLAIRNFAAATQRVDGPTERRSYLGSVEIEAIAENRIPAWLEFFDRRAFAGNFAWASCYCAEPHCLDPARREETGMRSWEENRARMQELLASGASFGYLAFVDSELAGWVNASLKSNYTLFRTGAAQDAETIGVACFVIAPPYRGFGLAARLLDEVIADAPRRGARWIEAYPFTEESRSEALGDFRGHQRMYEGRGFEVIERRPRDLVMRRSA